MDKREYALVTGISFSILVAISVIISTRVTYDSSPGLGIINKLPTLYWIGLVVVGLLIYPSLKSERFLVCVCILAFLFLFVVPALTKTYQSDFPQSYFFSSEGQQIAKSGHLVENSQSQLISYNNWPLFLYLSAMMQLVIGLSPIMLSDLFSLACILFISILVFLVLRINFSLKMSLLGLLWFISCFWLAQYYFSPQSISYIIFLITFLLTVTLLSSKPSLPKKTIAFMILFLFITTVFLHPLTPLIIISGMVSIYIFRKLFPSISKKSSIITFTACLAMIIFQFSYIIFVAYPAFSQGIGSLSQQLANSEPSPALTLLSQKILASPIQILSSLSSWSIVALNIIFFLFALRTKENRNNNLYWIAWLIGAIFFSFVIQYGSESYLRGFIFALVPLTYFCTLYLIKRPKLFCVILFSLLLLHIPAQYGKDFVYMTTQSEIAGTSFQAKYTSTNSSYFWSSYLTPILWYQDPNRLNYEVFVSSSANLDMKKIDAQTGNVEYLIFSQSSQNLYIYNYGFNPFIAFNFSIRDRCYDNDHFTIYYNQNAKQVT